VTDIVDVLVCRLDPDLPMPAYAHPGDAGADLVAAEDVELAPGERKLVHTGIAVALPDGFVGLVHPRSGLAARLGVTVLNAPGTVDSGYRGEILVNLINHDPVTPVTIARGDRIAQLIVQRVERAVFHVVDELPDTLRGAGGHGSTGGHDALGVSGTGPRAGSDLTPAQA
jgi:dUTP pyrophosphatase